MPYKLVVSAPFLVYDSSKAIRQNCLIHHHQICISGKNGRSRHCPKAASLNIGKALMPDSMNEAMPTWSTSAWWKVLYYKCEVQCQRQESAKSWFVKGQVKISVGGVGHHPFVPISMLRHCFKSAPLEKVRPWHRKSTHFSRYTQDFTHNYIPTHTQTQHTYLHCHTYIY